MGRWQLLQAILLFAGAPFQTARIVLAALGAARGWAPPAGRVAVLTLLWLSAIYLPKLLGYLQVLLSPPLRARYGGGLRFAGGALLEVGFSLLLDAIMGVSKTLGMLRLVTGAPPGWLPQNRADRGVRPGEAARLLWPHTLLGAAIFGLCAAGPPLALLWAVPVAGGLLLAIPVCVLTSDPRIGAWCRARGVAAVPEELASQPAAAQHSVKTVAL
jgi:membrane glycosyltransferase